MRHVKWQHILHADRYWRDRTDDHKWHFLPSFTTTTPPSGDVITDAVRYATERMSLAHRVLLVDELPPNAVPKYECDPEQLSWIWKPDKSVPIHLDPETDEVIVPIETFWSDGVIDDATFGDDVARLIREFTLNYCHFQNYALVKLFHAATEKREDQIVTNIGYGDISSCINHAFRCIEQHDLIVSTLFTNDFTFGKIRKEIEDKKLCDFDEGRRWRDGFVGHIFTADVRLVSDSILDNTLFAVSSPDTVGALPIEKDFYTTTRTNSKLKRSMVEIRTKYGMSVINDYSISRIDIVPDGR